MSGAPRPDDPTRVQSRSRPASGRGPGRGPAIAGRARAAWRALTPDQRLAAVAAIALLFSMLLPWYQETGFAVVRGRPVSLDDSKNAFQVYSFVEAAIFVVVAGVIALLWARAERKAFHLPGGDGTVIMGAGLWVMFLIFYRQLDKPDGRREGPISTSVGVEWGIFIAFLLGALLAFAGYRIRAGHTSEPASDDAPATVPPPGPGRPPARAGEPARRPPAPAPGEEPTTVAEPPRRPRDGEDRIDGQLSFDEPAEYRPPPRGS
jgi:hypothetical protein